MKEKVPSNSRGKVNVNTWEELKYELKVHFYLENVNCITRRKLRELRKTRLVQDYVKKFITIMLNIRDIIEKDKLFSIIDSLS